MDIPDTPFLIICEPSLLHMWEHECRRFFVYGLFNVIAWDTKTTPEDAEAMMSACSSAENMVIIISFVSEGE
jgi:hypothetical protein